MKANDLIQLVNYMQTFGPKTSKPTRFRKEKKRTSLQDLIETLQEAEEVKAYLASREKKEEKKDDGKKGVKIETFNQALFLVTFGPFVGIVGAHLFLQAMGLK